jgi:glycosyltransferase involved in cell wall biosynthesis
MVALGRPQSTSTAATIGSDGRLTVVIPTYNHGHFIAQALDSVFAQSRLPDRILVLDDGSTDDTATVMRRYLNETLLVEYIPMAENRGVIPMLNFGLGMIDTEFVVFLAADDTLEPAAFAKSLDALEAVPQAAVCGMFAKLIDESGRPLRRPRDFDVGAESRYLPPDECVARLYRDGGLFGGNGAIYRTLYLRQAGSFSEDLLSFCDGYRIQDLAVRHGVCFVPEALASWRQQRTSYAAKSREDPAASLAILNAVKKRIHEPSSAFPQYYSRRLEQRLRFAAAWAVLAQPNADAAKLTAALETTGRLVPELLVNLRRIGGRSMAKAALMLYLRPFDILNGLLRRVRRTQ